MVTIYDCLTDSTISARNKNELAKAISVDPSSISRLTTGFNLSINERYTLLKSNCFILEDVNTGEEFICATNHSFFSHLKTPFVENIAKYIYELIKGRQKTFLFLGRVFRLKYRPNAKKRRELYPKDFHKTKCPYKIQSRKITERIRCRLRGALKRQLQKKKERTFKYIGCSTEFLVGWLESQFTEGMSWGENIHIDHIIPCNTFDFNNEEEIYKCFHYTNLRPLWATDNLKRPKDGSDIRKI